jgi:hypothetical protein
MQRHPVTTDTFETKSYALITENTIYRISKLLPSSASLAVRCFTKIIEIQKPEDLYHEVILGVAGTKSDRSYANLLFEATKQPPTV